MNHRWMRLSVFLVGILIIGAGANRSVSAGQAMDHDHLAHDAAVTVIIHPAKIMGHVDPELKERQVLIDLMKEQSGIDITDIETVAFQVGTMGVEEDISVIVKFAKDVDLDPIVEKIMDGSEKVESKHKGNSLYINQDDSKPSVYVPNDNTLVVAQKGRLVKILDSTLSMTDLETRLNNAGDSCDIVIITNAEGALEGAVEDLADMGGALPIDPDVLVDQLRWVTFTANLSKKGFAKLQIETADAEGAGSVREGLEAALDQAYEALPEAREGIGMLTMMISDEETREQMEPMIEAAEKGIDLFEKILDNSKLSNKENVVTLDIKSDEEQSESAAQILVQTIATMMQLQEMVMDGIEIEIER